MGENAWAPRMATLEAIKRVNGAAELSTETLVEESEVDGNGFYPVKKRRAENISSSPLYVAT
jgi:hypothetical protein